MSNTNTFLNENSWQVLVLLIKKIAEKKGITHQIIAERTGLKAPNVTRIFSLKYCPSLRIFLAIAKAVEVNFFFEDKNETTDLSVLFESAMTELGRRIEQLPKQ